MARLRGVAEPEVDAAVGAVIARLRLDTVQRLTISKLSRGFRQRVAIAQALLGAPKLVILDEPTNGLDPRQIIELRGLVRDIAREHAVLVTSHILAEIERTAHRALILLDGRLLGEHRIGAGSEPLEDVFLRMTEAAAPSTSAAPGTDSAKDFA
jgi:ABC-2 type transport system ATP-binding protein